MNSMDHLANNLGKKMTKELFTPKVEPPRSSLPHVVFAVPSKQGRALLTALLLHILGELPGPTLLAVAPLEVAASIWVLCLNLSLFVSSWLAIRPHSGPPLSLHGYP